MPEDEADTDEQVYGEDAAEIDEAVKAATCSYASAVLDDEAVTDELFKGRDAAEVNEAVKTATCSNASAFARLGGRYR